MNEVLSVFMHLLVYFRALQVTLISPGPWGKKKKKKRGRDDSPSGTLEEEEKDDKDEDRPLTGDCCCQTNRDGECF